ncbi:PKD domain-containing protein, partial [bacterium]|nr:PKD domain-containing protein [bacterium]
MPINLTAEKDGYQTHTHDFDLSDPIPQNFKVSGTVVAENTGDPIKGVLVTLDWPTIAQIAYTDSIGYYSIALIITEGAGPYEDVVHDITLGQPPTANFSYLPEKPWVGIDITFDASISSDDGTIEYYNWTFDDGTEEKGGIGNIIVVHNYSAAGDYEVTLNVTDDDGLSDEIKKQINVVAPPTPTAKFSYSPENPVVGMDIAFDPSPSYDPDGTIEYYNWDFGDGHTDSRIRPVVAQHSYSSAGSYTVTLNVTDNDGLSDETTKLITVSESDKIELGFFCTGYDPVDKTVFYSTQSKFVNVNGTVTRADNGLPLPGANVTAYYGDMQQITAITDDQGEYFIPMLVNESGAGVEEKIVDAQLSLSEHKIVVTASKNGYQSTQVVVDYEAESEHQNLIVNGQVTDWNDIPIKDAEIRVQDWADWP